MRYFIDFEATQFSKEIISIGCIDEQDNTFYSEVYADNKVGNYVIELTSLTNDIIKNSPKPDEVFINFFDWVTNNIEDTENIEFITYGNCDVEFLKKELTKVTSYKAKAIILLMINYLVDYSIIVKQHFNLTDDVSLIKVLSHYRNLDTIVHQSHNSLDDAKYLKEIYENLSVDTTIIENNVFDKYIGQITKPKLKKKKKQSTNIGPTLLSLHETDDYKIYVYNGRKLIKQFTHRKAINSASNWVFSKLSEEEQLRSSKIKIKNKIIRAHLRNEKYLGCTWYIEHNNIAWKP